jgi:bis(5'-nucleosidyl)-tetraphosphatase
LHYHFKGDYWDFTRGKLEGNETEGQTARREIKEETGITDIKFLGGFRQTTTWFYRWKGRNIFKEAVYFLAETKEKKIKISEEHLEYLWLEYKEAMDTLTFDNTKKILKAANDFLTKN